MCEQRFTMAQMMDLAAKGVAKVDLMGTRGTTLVTCDELEAMACVIAMSGVLPPAAERLKGVSEPEFRSIRGKS